LPSDLSAIALTGDGGSLGEGWHDTHAGNEDARTAAKFPACRRPPEILTQKTHWFTASPSAT
jgi:hypothetical protein